MQLHRVLDLHKKHQQTYHRTYKDCRDVASFSNISAGAEPVLNAFRSALVGEREALKTYGIITEAEVQTEALYTNR